MNKVFVGLGDINVLRIEELKESGLLHVVIETKTENAKWASFSDQIASNKCGSSAKLKDRSGVALNDLTSSDRKVKLTWVKRPFSCNNETCSTKSFVKEEPQTPSSSLSISDRTAKFATQKVGRSV